MYRKKPYSEKKGMRRCACVEAEAKIGQQMLLMESYNESTCSV